MTSKYGPLKKYLGDADRDVIQMSFAEIEKVLGIPLPLSARQHAAWWANTKPSHSHAQSWLDAGRLASPDFVAGSVRFTLGVPKSRPRIAGQPSQPKHGLQEIALPLQSLGETGEFNVSFEWLDGGVVAFRDDRLVFPKLPAKPGVYRFTISDQQGSITQYVGESDNLTRRMMNYRNPGPTQPTNVRMNARLMTVLRDGGSVAVAIILKASTASQELDLAHKSSRLVVENVVLVRIRVAGGIVENL